MATYFIDFAGGNDANDGTTFALRKKTYTGITPTAGDEVRFAKSPDPLPIGNATWTTGTRPDPINIASSTNASPIVITTSANHGLVAGDYVSIISHTVNTNANGLWKVGAVTSPTVFSILQMDGSNTTGNGIGGATGNSTYVTNCFVKLASPLTQNVALCGGLGQKINWTGSTNVTPTITTAANSYKEGYGGLNISIAAAFTTGVATYYNFPSAIDLSGYQQLCFWIRQTSGTIASANDVTITLCSGTNGTSPQNTFNIPSTAIANSWIPVVVDLGTNLFNSIASIAFNVVVDRGAQVFQIDNIFASKASSSNDALNLTSLISKSSGTGDEPWYGIQSINFDAVMLSSVPAYSPDSSTIAGYSNGVTATIATYRRETFKPAPFATAINVNTSGSLANPIIYSGGWDTSTSMTTQTGVSYYDGALSGFNGTFITGNADGILLSGVSNLYFDKLYMCRYNTGFNAIGPSTGITVATIFTANCRSGFRTSGGVNTITATKLILNNSNDNINLSPGINCYFLEIQSSSGGVIFSNNSVKVTIDNLVVASSASVPPLFGANVSNLYIKNLTCKESRTYSLNVRASLVNVVVGGGTLDLPINMQQSFGQIYLNNVTISSATEVVYPSNINESYVYSNRHDNTDNNSWIWLPYGTINQQSSVIDSPATTSWRMSPSVSNNSSFNPVFMKLATVVCAANSLVTVTARMLRSDTGLTMRLICPGGQILGVENDVFSDMTAAANTWETVTITFTPTRPGGVNIYAHAFGGTIYNGYVCNVNASQA